MAIGVARLAFVLALGLLGLPACAGSTDPVVVDDAPMYAPTPLGGEDAAPLGGEGETAEREDTGEGFTLPTFTMDPTILDGIDACLEGLGLR